MQKLTEPQARQLADSLRSWIESESHFNPFTNEDADLLQAYQKALKLAHLFRPSKHLYPDQVEIYKAANWIFFLPYTQPENHFSSSCAISGLSEFTGYSQDFLTWRRALKACGLIFEYNPSYSCEEMIQVDQLEGEFTKGNPRDNFIQWLKTHVVDCTMIQAFLNKEELILHRKVLSYNEDNGSDGITPKEVDQTDWIDKYEVGGEFVVSAGAPGIGVRVYKVTRKDEKGLWGKIEIDTFRELNPSEVV